jgi:hypothetical protein
MIRTLSLACAAALLLTGPATAQKFLSVTGETTRMTVGEIAARDAEAAATGTQEAGLDPEAAVEDMPIADPAGAAQAEAAGATPEEEPAVAEAEAEAAPAPSRDTARVTGPCGVGAVWDAGSRTCRSF